MYYSNDKYSQYKFYFSTMCVQEVVMSDSFRLYVL